MMLDAPATRRRRCRECRRAYDEPIRQAGPTVTCSPECKQARRRRLNRQSQRRYLQRLELRYLRALPEDGMDNRGPYFALTVRELREAREAYDAGWHVSALATRFGVSERTIFRALRLGPPKLVTIGRYSAWFAAQDTGLPVQLSGWHHTLEEESDHD